MAMMKGMRAAVPDYTGTKERTRRQPLRRPVVQPAVFKQQIVRRLVIDDPKAELASADDQNANKDQKWVRIENANGPGRNDREPAVDEQSRALPVRASAELTNLIAGKNVDRSQSRRILSTSHGAGSPRCRAGNTTTLCFSAMKGFNAMNGLSSMKGWNHQEARQAPDRCALAPSLAAVPDLGDPRGPGACALSFRCCTVTIDHTRSR